MDLQKSIQKCINATTALNCDILGPQGPFQQACDDEGVQRGSETCDRFGKILDAVLKIHGALASYIWTCVDISFELVFAWNWYQHKSKHLQKRLQKFFKAITSQQ